MSRWSRLPPSNPLPTTKNGASPPLPPGTTGFSARPGKTVEVTASSPEKPLAAGWAAGQCPAAARTVHLAPTMAGRPCLLPHPNGVRMGYQ